MHNIIVSNPCVKLSTFVNTGSYTVETEIIETGARTLELPLLVRSVVSAESRRISLAVFSPPNLKEEILDVLAPVSIISVFTVANDRKNLNQVKKVKGKENVYKFIPVQSTQLKRPHPNARC